MNKKDNSNFMVIIAVVIIVCIVSYIAYSMFNNSRRLNINTLDDMIENIDMKTNVEEVPIEKEIVYDEIEISSFTSTLYDNEENRVFNITKACQILNGVTINPGEEFSFCNTIGPMGEENGFLKATGFDSQGKLIQVSAGGMCQVSSTLYNVALLANLEITERHPHSRRVYYVPADKDATVYYGSLDLKFINNTQDILKITAVNDNYSVTIKMYKLKQSN